MITEAFYLCFSCGATKKIINNSARSGNENPEFPSDLVCGWRDCEERAQRINKEKYEFSYQRLNPINKEKYESRNR